MPSRIRDVRSPTAVSQASANGACPPSCRQGRKWSETTALSSPSSSARTPNSTSSRGPNCSADALYPIRNDTLEPVLRPRLETIRGLDLDPTSPASLHPCVETRMRGRGTLPTVGQAMSNPDHSTAGGRVALSTLRRLAPYVAPHRAALIGSGVAALVATLAGLAVPLLTRAVVDGPVGPR